MAGSPRHRLWTRGLPTVALAAALAANVAWTSAPRRPAGSPYGARSVGYDLSYPDCIHRRPPPRAFAIVGVNGGRPFTFNPCLRRENAWYARHRPRALYLNTGYDPAFRSRIVPNCWQRADPSHPTRAALAYAIGCTEAAASLEHMTKLHLTRPAIWWLDVETSNTWSPNRVVNSAVLQGMVDFLERLAPAPAVGIYSRPSWWREITADWSTSTPEWIPSRSAGCPAPFSAGPVWLHQTGSPGIDLDAAC